MKSRDPKGRPFRISPLLAGNAKCPFPIPGPPPEGMIPFNEVRSFRFRNDTKRQETRWKSGSSLESLAHPAGAGAAAAGQDHKTKNTSLCHRRLPRKTAGRIRGNCGDHRRKAARLAQAPAHTAPCGKGCRGASSPARARRREVFTPSWVVNKMNNYADANVGGRTCSIPKMESVTATYCFHVFLPSKTMGPSVAVHEIPFSVLNTSVRPNQSASA